MDERKISEQEHRELIERAKEGDSSAFAALYEYYYADIYNFIYHRVGNVQFAEDLTAEVFLKALESIDSFTFRGIPFPAWLFRLTRNLMIDYSRTHPEPLEMTLPLEEGVLPTAEGRADDVYERKLTRRKMLQALNHLTEEQRDVVVLKFVEGFSNTDVAQILGKSEGAIKSLQHRALDSLSRIWEEVSAERNQVFD